MLPNLAARHLFGKSLSLSLSLCLFVKVPCRPDLEIGLKRPNVPTDTCATRAADVNGKRRRRRGCMPALPAMQRSAAQRQLQRAHQQHCCYNTHTHTQPARRPPTNSATGSRVSQFVAGGPLAAWLQRRRRRAFQTFPAHGQHRRPRRLAIDSRDTGNMSARRDVNSALPDSRALYHTFHRTKSSDDDLPPIAGLEK